MEGKGGIPKVEEGPHPARAQERFLILPGPLILMTVFGFSVFWNDSRGSWEGGILEVATSEEGPPLFWVADLGYLGAIGK